VIRREESRREVIDDLLRGDAEVARLVERAEPFGLDLALTHLVVLAAPGSPLANAETAAAPLERAVVDRFGDRDVLVATKDRRLVAWFGSRSHRQWERPSCHVDVAEFVQWALRRARQGGRGGWPPIGGIRGVRDRSHCTSRCLGLASCNSPSTTCRPPVELGCRRGCIGSAGSGGPAASDRPSAHRRPHEQMDRWPLRSGRPVGASGRLRLAAYGSAALAVAYATINPYWAAGGTALLSIVGGQFQ
jgi:hypothetical protein